MIGVSAQHMSKHVHLSLLDFQIECLIWTKSQGLSDCPFKICLQGLPIRQLNLYPCNMSSCKNNQPMSLTLQEHCCKSGLSSETCSVLYLTAVVDVSCGRRSLASWIVGIHILRPPCGSSAWPTCPVDSVFDDSVIAAGQLRLSNFTSVAFLNQKQACCAQ